MYKTGNYPPFPLHRHYHKNIQTQKETQLFRKNLQKEVRRENCDLQRISFCRRKMSISPSFSETGRFSGRRMPEKSNFSHTCSLLSQYLKEKGTFGDLSLGMTCNPQGKGIFVSFPSHRWKSVVFCHFLEKDLCRSCLVEPYVLFSCGTHLRFYLQCVLS